MLAGQAKVAVHTCPWHLGNTCGQAAIVQQGVDGSTNTAGVITLLVLGRADVACMGLLDGQVDASRPVVAVWPALCACTDGALMFGAYG